MGYLLSSDKIRDLYHKLDQKRDKKITIRVRARALSGAIQALDRMAEDCALSNDEHARMIDVAYWSGDFFDILNAVNKRTRWWRKTKEQKAIDKYRKERELKPRE